MKRWPRYLLLLAVISGAGMWASAKPKKPVELELMEPAGPPPRTAARDNPLARSPRPKVVQGFYQSIQVNGDAQGQNIVGDAANEPSIAVNPTNPANIVIGWRQFDSIATNFRQPGWAYSFDSGVTWTFPGVVRPGLGSDPVLDTDLQGTFYYQMLDFDTLSVDVYRSTNGGVSWLAPVSEFGGDKNWFAIDKSGGASSGHRYGIWQRFGSCCDTDVFTRSTDGGASFQSPVPVEKWPSFGTLSVGPLGEVYATGIETIVFQDVGHYAVAKSVNASNPATTPTFTAARVNVPGGLGFSTGPNPSGLLGQPGIAVDRSSGSMRGNAYLATTVVGADPGDVYVVRSTDGGSTWNAPVRVNDDPSQDNWQWFAQHSVAPNGRIDVVWNDSRNTGQPNLAQLYYAYSWDGGATWSPNVAVSPVFDSFLGYPFESHKMGDYLGIVSAATGADVAYTATFNGEEDIYYVRVFPDCNANGISDVTDLANATSADCNLDKIPDECRPTICGPPLTVVSSAPADTCPAGGSGNADGSIDPGEDAALSVTLRNDGSITLTGISAKLATTTPGVTVTRASATFPNIPAHGTGVSNAPGFAFTVGSGVACGDSIAFTLSGSSFQGSWTRAFSVRVGSPVPAGTFDATDVPKPVASLSTTTSSIVLPAGTDVFDLDVGLNLSYSNDADLIIMLIGPDGRRNLLAYYEGDTGQDYTATVFDDEAAQRIDLALAPFTGHFTPRQTLSSFDGTASAGTWTLEIQDDGGGSGTLTAWSLTPTLVSGVACHACNVPAPALEPVTVNWNVGRTSLAWESIPGATFYDTFRGARADLPSLLGPSADSCLRVATIPTTTGSVLTETPPAGGGLYWYLVRAGNGGGLGPAGNASSGPRSQESVGACP